MVKRVVALIGLVIILIGFSAKAYEANSNKPSDNENHHEGLIFSFIDRAVSVFESNTGLSETGTFNIIDVGMNGDRKAAIVRWKDGTVKSFDIENLIKEKELASIKGLELVVKYGDRTEEAVAVEIVDNKQITEK